MSLLGYCYFSLQDYVNASDCYEQLTVLYPDQEQYKLYYAQALYKCGLHEESFRAVSQIENAELKAKVNFNIDIQDKNKNFLKNIFQ